MNHQTDSHLLRSYAEDRLEPAFAELVRRHVDFVYTAAIRMIRDPHLAEDVTQGVFLALAKSAPQLLDRATLSGWLHQTAQNIAAQTVRTIERRRAREQEVMVMNQLPSSQTENSWEQIAPHLDAALGELSESDRDAVLLRYFERKSAGEIGQCLGVSEEAAQKRVSRAVERLRELFARRGVAVGAGIVVALISANAVQAAPAGLATAISAGVLAGTAVTTSTLITATKTIAMTAFQKIAITTALIAVAGAGIFEARQAAQLRAQNRIFQEAQAPLTEQNALLQKQRDDTSNRLAELTAENAQLRSGSNRAELLKMRGEVTAAQNDSRELARMKSSLDQKSQTVPDYLTNSMAMGLGWAEKGLTENAQTRVARMKAALGLTDQQAQAINDVMAQHIKNKIEAAMQKMTGKASPENSQAPANDDEDAEIKALLNADQLAAYPNYLQSEKIFNADNSASTEAKQVGEVFKLSADQQTQIQTALYNLNMNDADKDLDQQAIAEAKKSGDLAQVASLTIAREKSELEKKVAVLGNYLTPEQIETYRKERMSKLDLLAAAMKMIVPNKAAPPAQ